MLRHVRQSLSFANVVSLLALFVALGGTSYAALKVGSKQITNNSVRSKDLRNNDIRGADVRNRSLGSKDFKSGQLPRGAQGPQGPQGAQGLQGAPGTSVFAASIPSRATVRGAFSVGLELTGGATLRMESAVSFPTPAPTPPTDAQVNFAPGAAGTDDDPTCTGTFATPTAPPGKVCIYPNGRLDASTGEGLALNNRYGFTVAVSEPGPGVALEGTWAYTAP
ncbi:MAG TPA: hypothetical protein VD790_08890 [Thermoleophilaceae bacterium]|nr:hypothetical protein [Thermoleophilaceae bacterium]